MDSGHVVLSLIVPDTIQQGLLQPRNGVNKSNE